jgi:hypothetical protein
MENIEDKNKNISLDEENVSDDNDKNTCEFLTEMKKEETEYHENEIKQCSTGDPDNHDSSIDKKKNSVSHAKQKYIGVEVYTHLQHTMETKKMYPLLPCNMISSFAHVMEYVEYFDIPSEERKKLVIDLVKILAYSNNDHGSRDCFEYFVEHNMIDDIMQTIIDSTKNRFDINRFPHTNRRFVLSCVSLSNKIKIVKPSAKVEALFEEFKLNLCGLKRFFKMRDKDDLKQT